MDNTIHDNPPNRHDVTPGENVVGGRNLESGPQDSSALKAEQLPDEIQHITTDILPLSLLLTRLAEFSHAKLQDIILELASKPLPPGLANGNVNGSVNGNGAGHNAIVEDTSAESLDKKAMLLNFIKDLHTRWVKALVITEWSRNADEVGKLIDIRSHLAEKLELYHKTFWGMVEVKREMLFARVPSPDFKTALEVLSNGAVHWMPDFNYVPPPPLTADETLRWVHEIEMHMHARLQLEEFDTMPEPFKQYKIADGRVTFTVPGEFEVDLTLGHEDFTSQFWFLDFRLIYSPAPPAISEPLRNILEARVNDALAATGLMGCYNYLHEFTLTAKVNEFTRQAVGLSSKGCWVHTLKIERLDRALAIQYWLNREHSRATSSWILLGVYSGGDRDNDENLQSSSHLTLNWFRDGQQVKDVEIPFDTDAISTENLLMAVMSTHIEHLLLPIYSRLLAKPRFAHKQGRLALRLGKDPQLTELDMQLLGGMDVAVRVSPWTGNFLLIPEHAGGPEIQRKFKSLTKPAEEGASALEQIRWSHTVQHLRELFKLAGWVFLRTPPVPFDEIKDMVYSKLPAPREAFLAVWVRNPRWDPEWSAVLSLSLAGDHWWMVETSTEAQGITDRRIKSSHLLPITTDDLSLSDSFLPKLAIYAPSIMVQVQSLRDLQRSRSSHSAQQAVRSGLFAASPQENIPLLRLRASDVMKPTAGPQAHVTWIGEFIPVVYKEAASPPLSVHQESTAGDNSLQRSANPLEVILEAKVAVTDRARLSSIRGRLDRNVLYDSQLGLFTLRFRSLANSSIVPPLRARILELDRLLHMAEAVRRAGKRVVLERVTLRELTFTYGGREAATSALDPQAQRPWRVRLNLAREKDVDVILEKGNPHLRVIDFLRTSANSAGFKSMPAWLLLTSPLFRALERLQDAWDAPMANKQGECYIIHKSLDWVSLRFALAGPKSRRLQLEIKARNRKGELKWQVQRPPSDANAANENDEFNRVLTQSVWSTSGDGYKGLMTGAAAAWGQGIENLLLLISNTLLSMLGNPPPAQPDQPQHLQQQHQQRQQQHPVPPLAGGQNQEQHGAPPHGIPVPQGPPPNFQLQQPPQPRQLQQHRLSQQHMSQPNMHGQGQLQGQGQGQRPGVGGNNNASVVVLE